jgi:hypothetical protein
MATKTVTISFDGTNIGVDPYGVDLSYSKRDNVEWVCDPKDAPFTFVVTFWLGKTPFRETRFDKEHKNSGDIHFRPRRDKYFKYSVEVYQSGKVFMLDPGVIIIP